MKYPVIVVREIVVFPKHKLTLDVGRPMSLTAMKIATEKFGGKVVIVAQRDAHLEVPATLNDLNTIGTLVNIVETKDLAGGIKQIAVQGIERLKISSFEITEGYIASETKPVRPKAIPDAALEKDLISKISKSLESVIGVMMNVPKDVMSLLAEGISANELIDIVGHYMPMAFSRKQELLETTDTQRRLVLLNEILLQELGNSKLDKKLDNSIRQNLDQQQREFLLREKMKAIKEELGDLSSKESEVDKWREQINDPKFPEYVRVATLEEIRKYESTPQMAAESNVIRGYIEWIFNLPWQTFSTDNDSLDRARRILDSYHYGLVKVKERIIEHLAVRINTKGTSHAAPIITLVGPPGVGKTSLAAAIAEAIGRKFVKISLGGVRDEAEIRGHRRTYVGAMPGKIIQAIKKAKTSNPVVLLDEIDKMSADYKGDPTSAMLEVLDPEQNKNFQDHFLEIEYDLSKVMFIATANYYENIPAPLLDRVEIINIDQYTSEEKLSIAQRHIIPKVISDNGLAKDDFKLSPKIISYIISKYTAEAGVRGLRRELDKLARKIIVRRLTGEIKGEFVLDETKVKELLGREQVEKEELAGKSEVGLVNGMYYSSVGGGILPIEVTTFESKNGGTVLTGSIREVMKESLNIAIAYIRANAPWFGINFNWEGRTIQVHVPAGAVPKDGPSAGIAFTTAIVSALSGMAVPKTIALTGEITLRGKVLPIGGLKQKALGAVEAGVKTIFIPKKNEKDIEELPKKVLEKAKIISVDDYKEVFKAIFGNPPINKPNQTPTQPTVSQ